MATLQITAGKGLRLTFDNGYSLSIQIGPGNYCDNYGADIGKWCRTKASECMFESATAEIAVFKGDEWCNPNPPFDVLEGTHTDVDRYVPINDVLDRINAIRALPE